MKVGLVYSFEDSNWFSVTKIVGNLLKAYKSEEIKAELVHIDFSIDKTKQDNVEAANNAFEKGLDRLVFIDHNPHPFLFLSSIRPDDLDLLDEITFHVYGDFTLYLRSWKACEHFLVGRKIKFVCASDKQAKLIKKFLSNDCVSVSPFPVDSNEFKFSDQNKSIVREKHGLKEDDFIFLYTGRLSEQKKSKEMIENFLECLVEKKLPMNCKLLIAGKFDNLGTPYLEEDQLLGEYFRKTQKVLNRFPEEISRNVILIGNIPNASLVDYYNCADRFVSFSCYHDEDYGMSVAEALMSGLPCLLTDWAGYSSFKIPELDGATVHIPVKLGEKRAEYNKHSAMQELESCFLKPLSSSSRQKLAELANEKFSIGACSKKLQIIQESSEEGFKGFSRLLHHLGAVNEFKPHLFMNECSKTFNEFYYKVYDVYAE
ncbi:MAG: hypothetical protein CME64_13730 [Halobacteriovoraceae bacterium]|nr:hypothetical protein [Halobacteriovoraceae bacterium]|tara:strand:- start:46725 stop:48011 length:1287 start_codon:yes stop_codon:yes gene_type:complete